MTQAYKNPEKAWKDLLLCDKQDVETSLLKLLDIYRKLRQIPNLIASLQKILQETTSTKCTINVKLDKWPQSYVQSFADCCQSLPIGQILTLWKILSDGIKNLLPLCDSSSNLGPIRLVSLTGDLLSALFMNARLIDHSIPAAMKENAVELLLAIANDCNVALLRSFIVTESESLGCTALSVIHSWGEVFLLLKQYSPQSRLSLGMCHHKSWDLSFVHFYANHRDWKTIHRVIKLTTNDSYLGYLHALLVQQKLHALLQFGIEPSEEIGDQLVYIKETAEYQGKMSLGCLDRMMSNGSSNGPNEFKWEIIRHHLPTLISHWPEAMTQEIINSLISVHQKPNIGISNLLSSPVCSEIKQFQSAIINSVLERISSLFQSIDSSVGILIMQLYHSSGQWFEQDETHPRDREGNIQQLWKTISDVSSQLNTIFKQELECRNQCTVFDCEALLQHFQVLELLPLQYLLPRNQTRLLLAMCLTLSAVSHIHTSDNSPSLFTELIKTIHKITITILDGLRSLWFFDFIHSGHFLNWFAKIHASWATQIGVMYWNDLKKSYQSSLIKYLLLSTRSAESFLKLDVFINEITDSKERTLSKFEKEVQTLSIITTMEVLQIVASGRYNAIYTKMLQTYQEFLLKISSWILHSIKESIKLNTLSDESSSLVRGYGLVAQASVSLKAKGLIKLKWKKYLSSVVASAVKILQTSSNLEHKLYCAEMLNVVFSHLNTCSQHLSDDGFTSLWPVIIKLYKQEASNTLSEADRSNLMIVIESLIKVAVANCSEMDFLSIIQQLEVYQAKIDCKPSKLMKTSHVLNVWLLILSSEFNSDKFKVVIPATVMLLAHLQIKLLEVKSDEEILNLAIKPMFEIIRCFLHRGKGRLNLDVIDLCLSCCSCICPSDIASITSFVEMAELLYYILNEMMVYHLDAVVAMVPSFVGVAIQLLKAILQRSNQDALMEMPEYIDALVGSAQNLERLFSLFSTDAVHFKRVVAYVVTVYISEIQRTPVIPAVKVRVTAAIYHLLDLCDEHSQMLLKTNLPQSSKVLFNELYQNYNKHFKYKGKV